MHGITKILAVIDSRKEQQLALDKAAQFCRINGAVLYILAPNPNTTEESMNRLKAHASPLSEEGLEVHLHETWHDNLTDTILHIQKTEQCHLIIKDARPYKPVKNTFKTPNDWSLLRRSHTPVLLVQTSNAWNSAPIMAAINADPDDYNHGIMNTVILDYARELASDFSSQVLLAAAYPSVHLAARNYDDSITDEEAYHRNCVEYARQYKLAEDNLLIEPGPTETLIPRLIEKSGAQLLILGTHARTGLSAFAVGNTAEQLITEVDIDILVIQPDHQIKPQDK